MTLMRLLFFMAKALKGTSSALYGIRDIAPTITTCSDKFQMELQVKLSMKYWSDHTLYVNPDLVIFESPFWGRDLLL